MTRPLVLLHGFTGSPGSWTAVGTALPRPDVGDAGDAGDVGDVGDVGDGGVSRRSGSGAILAPAVLGHDGTPGPPGIERFEEEVDRLAGAIEERGFVGAHLAGYSLGGRLALGLLVRHRELFASATLIGASPGLSDPRERAERAARDEAWARLLDEEGLDTFVAAWQALPLFATQDHLPADVQGRQRRIRDSHDPRGLARSLRVVGLSRMPDYRADMDGIDIPVRLVVGAHDPKFRGLAEEMAERLPRASLTVIRDAGHNVVLESPVEIAGLLREDMTA